MARFDWTSRLTRPISPPIVAKINLLTFVSWDSPSVSEKCRPKREVLCLTAEEEMVLLVHYVQEGNDSRHFAKSCDLTRLDRESSRGGSFCDRRLLGRLLFPKAPSADAVVQVLVTGDCNCGHIALSVDAPTSCVMRLASDQRQAGVLDGRCRPTACTIARLHPALVWTNRQDSRRQPTSKRTQVGRWLTTGALLVPSCPEGPYAGPEHTCRRTDGPPIRRHESPTPRNPGAPTRSRLLTDRNWSCGGTTLTVTGSTWVANCLADGAIISRICVDMWAPKPLLRMLMRSAPTTACSQQALSAHLPGPDGKPNDDHDARGTWTAA